MIGDWCHSDRSQVEGGFFVSAMPALHCGVHHPLLAVFFSGCMVLL